MTRLSFDCYSKGERAAMVETQNFRGRLLTPLLQWLARWGVHANHITLLSMLSGLAFCPLVFWSPLAAIIMLALHLLLDGLDGPLARFRKTASPKGSFTDTMADQTVVVATTVTLMVTQTAGIVAGGVYIFLYTVVVLFAMFRNAMEIPYSWLLRPRFVVYGWLIVEVFLLPGSLDFVLWGCNLLLAAKMLSGFAKIRSRL